MTKRPTLSRLDTTTSLSISIVQESLKDSKSGALTETGGKSSLTRMSTSSIGKTRNALMLVETKMRKEHQSLYTRDTMVTTKDGQLSILMKPRRSQPRDSAKISDSTSTDHSTWSQDFHSTELQNLLVPTISPLRDGERMLKHNNGGSIMRRRLLEIITGRTMA